MARAKKNSKGLYQKSFRYDGKRYYVSAKSLESLDDKVTEKKKELRDKAYKGAKEITFREYADNYHEKRREKIRQSTFRKEGYVIRELEEVPIDENGKLFGSLIIAEMVTPNLEQVQQYLREHKKEKRNGKGDVPGHRNTNTVNQYMAILKAIIKKATIEYRLDYNPCDALEAYKRTEEQARDNIHRALTAAETAAFFANAGNSFYYDLYRFMIKSGVRVGEAGALKQSDIKRGKIWIMRTLTNTAEGHTIIGDDCKTAAGKRAIPLTDELNQIIEDQKERNRNAYKVVPIDAPIFRTMTGCLLHTGRIDRDIERICKRAGIDRFSSHCFRDTFATNAIDQGMKPKTLQTILGHKDIGVTMNLYCHSTDETVEKEFNNVHIAI